MHRNHHHLPLIQFLQTELAISEEAIAVALKHPEAEASLPMILWQYGLVSLEQLGRIFDWLSDQSFKASLALLEIA